MKKNLKGGKNKALPFSRKKIFNRRLLVLRSIQSAFLDFHLGLIESLCVKHITTTKKESNEAGDLQIKQKC